MGPLYQKEAFAFSPGTLQSFPSVEHFTSTFLLFPFSASVMWIELSPSSITQVAFAILVVCCSLLEASNCQVPARLGWSCAAPGKAKRARARHAAEVARLRIEKLLSKTVVCSAC